MSQSKKDTLFVHGIPSVASFIFLFLIFPELINDFFRIGFSDLPLIIVLSVIPIAFLLIFVGIMPIKVQIVLYTLSNLLSGALSFILGLITLYNIDDNNLPTVYLIAVFLSSSFLALYTEFLRIHNQPMNSETYVGYNVRLILGIFIIASIFIAFDLFSWLLFAVGFVYILGIFLFLGSDRIFPFQTQENLEIHPAEIYSSSQSSTKTARNDFLQLFKLRYQLLSSILFMIPVSIMFFLVSTMYDLISFPLSLIGLAFGLFFQMQFGKQAYNNPLIKAIPLLLTFGGYLIFMIQPDMIANPGSNPLYLGLDALLSLMFGISTGIVISEIWRALVRFKQVPNHKMHRLGGWVFFTLLSSGVAGGLSQEFQSVIIDDPEFLWIGIVLIILLGLLQLLPFLIQHINRKRTLKEQSKVLVLADKSALKKPVSHELPIIEPRLVNSKAKRVFTTISLIMMILMPIFSGILFLNSGTEVYIDLGKTMYLVDGTAVTQVSLKERSALILLNTPNSIGTPHSELIRENKSVRLGGYYYGLGTLTVAESIEYIGNNFDVFSLGLCAPNTSPTSMTPDNITSIRALNAAVRFYYMAFATTLFEDALSTFTGAEWGDSHYPTVKWNDTMHEWTVKLDDGTEAMGVRRNPNNLNAHLMDLGNSNWTDYFAWVYNQRVNQFHADGVAIDEVMWNGYWDVDTEDLRDYTTVAEIRSTCYDWLERLESKFDSDIITQAFWDDAQIYQEGIWGEIAFRSGGQYGDRVDDRRQSVWYEQMNWKEIVENMVNHASRDRSYIWAAWYERGNKESLEYAIATYLMGKQNGNVSLVFHPQPIYDGGYGDNNMAGYALSTVQEEIDTHSELFDLEMGDAINQMYLQQGLGGSYWKREYENGIVLVNPYHAYVPGFGP
jgi:hypothetical protein